MIVGEPILMKQVLMIIPFFPPLAGGGVYRPLSFVRYLGDYGWQPTVIAPRGDSFWIRDESLVKRIPDSVRVVRTGTLSAQRILALAGRRRGSGGKQVRSTRGFSLLRRCGSFFLVPDTYIGWYPFALREAERLLRSAHFDALYSTSPPETSHVIAAALHKRFRIPWVADFRDPWMNLHLFKPPTPLHTALHKRLERRVTANAGIVVTNRWHFDRMKAHVADPARLVRIPNGYDREEAGRVDGVRPSPERFRIVHTGMLTQQRSAEPFLRALKRFIDDTPGSAGRVEVLFIGPREDRNDVLVRELQLDDCVRFLDTVPHARALELQRSSHILLLIKHLDPLYRGIIPGKVYEYIGMRRPVLALVPEGELADLIRTLRRGETVSQSDEAEIASVLEKLYRGYLAGTLDGAYQLDFVPGCERRELAGKLASFLDTLMQGGTNRR